MAGSIGHVAAGFISLFLTGFLAATMADGRSLLELKPSARSGNTVSDYAATGVFKDYKGYTWEHSDNPLRGCHDISERGQALVAFVFMATVFSGFSVICNLMGAQSGTGVFGMASAGLNGINFVWILIAMSLAASIYDESHCGGELKKTMDLGYALPFFVIALLLSLVNVGALVATGALGNSSSEPPAGATEPAMEEPKKAA
eukprot:TRINITY_DN1487_c0_g1_i1.p1 TRINITY_DN1487_c0_g1~~TRINITY_DN1487_c0_g1_i1.p1  ORF type:complete len:222 (+),score=96.30 TRINITY_DN1487_c0_g1_i1:61-666(+)